MASLRSVLAIILACLVLCLAGSASGARTIRATRTMLEKAPEAYRDGDFNGNGEWWLRDAPEPADMEEWHMSPPPASMQTPPAPTYNTSPPPYYASPAPHYSTSPPPYGGYGGYGRY